MAEALPEAMQQLLHDEDGKHCEAQLLSLCRRLQQDGRNPHSLVRALLRTTISISGEMPMLDAMHFLERAHSDLGECLEIQNDFLRNRDVTSPD